MAERLARVGLGVDRHPLAAGRALWLGGVRIRSDRGLLGHSDADVLLHAVCDALLGALGLPDMGTRFPSSVARWRGRRSAYFVRDAARAARRRGFEVVNLDAVVLAEAPRLAPHLAAMRRRIAAALGCAPGRVSIKPKRGEGLGFVGRGEGMEAHAVVLLAPLAGRPARRRRAR